MKIRISGLFISIISFLISCNSGEQKSSEGQRAYPIYLKVYSIAENPPEGSPIAFAANCLGIIEWYRLKLDINILEPIRIDPNLIFPRSKIWTIDFKTEVGDFPNQYANGTFNKDVDEYLQPGGTVEIGAWFSKEENDTLEIKVKETYGNNNSVIWFCQKLLKKREVKALKRDIEKARDEVANAKNKTSPLDSNKEQ